MSQTRTSSDKKTIGHVTRKSSKMMCPMFLLFHATVPGEILACSFYRTHLSLLIEIHGEVQ